MSDEFDKAELASGSIYKKVWEAIKGPLQKAYDDEEKRIKNLPLDELKILTNKKKTPLLNRTHKVLLRSVGLRNNSKAKKDVLGSKEFLDALEKHLEAFNRKRKDELFKEELNKLSDEDKRLYYAQNEYEREEREAAEKVRLEREAEKAAKEERKENYDQTDSYRFGDRGGKRKTRRRKTRK